MGSVGNEKNVRGLNGGVNRGASFFLPSLKLDSCVEVCGPDSVMEEALEACILVNFSDPLRCLMEEEH